MCQGVMGIETFMETATALSGSVPQGLKDVHFYLPIKLLRNRPQAVRVIGAEVGGDISMEIESDFINSKGVKNGQYPPPLYGQGLAERFRVHLE